jgi:NAD(P)-dependent dehydrogenase (short-subunit alcohol dehydrogenase family)
VSRWLFSGRRSGYERARITGTKVALVTGASSGFGLFTAVALAREAFVTYASMRDPARRGEVDAEARAAGVSVEHVTLDVRERERKIHGGASASARWRCRPASRGVPSQDEQR